MAGELEALLEEIGLEPFRGDSFDFDLEVIAAALAAGEAASWAVMAVSR